MASVDLPSIEQGIIADMVARRPDLDCCVEALLRVHETLVQCYDKGGKLLVCGNGGSHADSIHIVGELCKSFERRRTLPPKLREGLEGLPWGEELQGHLEAGLAAVTLGLNSALKTAVENDSPLRDMAFAQETAALAKPGDVLLAISTSGNAVNCLMAQSVAKASGCTTVSLTGAHGGKMALHADIALKAPGDSVKVIQEAHIALYHTMCCLIEARYFPDMR